MPSPSLCCGDRREPAGTELVSNNYGDDNVSPHTLAGATILQIVPDLRDEPVARTAVNVASALMQSGARAIIAAEDGPLADELRACGGEWIALATATINPFTLRSCAHKLERLIASERIDIVHAQSIGGAWAANMAATQIAVWLVTTLADVPPVSGLRAYWAGSLARGDRVITPSNFAASPVMKRFELPRERLTVIPRSIDTRTFDPAAVGSERIEALRASWRLSPNDRIVLVPGRVAPWNGQLIVPHIARILLDSGERDFVIVMAGEHETFRKYARFIAEEAKRRETAAFTRFAGHCLDMPAAFAAADTVLVPTIEAPVLGRAVAEAQAMGRPVVASNIGILPEHVVTPPEMPEDVRTGWLAEPGDAADFARALGISFSLDETAYGAMAARARQFAEYMFSPRSIAVATRAVYTSLLARDT
jgi:glycosyltransferase involved in cell wall biosynthesis